MKNEVKIPFFLAWKYLRRGNKWTHLLTIFLMAVAFVNLVFINSLFSGIIKGTNEQIINTLTGNIYITPKDGDDYINSQSEVITKISKIEGVEGVSSQIFVPASLKYNNYKGNWSVFAIDPDKEKTVTNVSEKLTSGEYLNSNDLDSIIIGRQIAGGEGIEEDAFSFKGAKVGEKVTLFLNGYQKEFTIKGIFYTKFLDTDQRAYITRSSLQSMIPDIDDKATTINIKLSKGYQEQEVINEIKDQGVELNIYSWEEVNGIMSSVATSFLTINVLMTFVGVLIAAVTIFIIIYIDIVNKKRQIGILRAIGVRPYIISCCYMIQAGVYSVFGVLLGTVMFFGIIVPYFNYHPFVLPICDAVLVPDTADFISRAELIMWVAVVSALIPSIIVTRSKILSSIFGK